MHAYIIVVSKTLSAIEAKHLLRMCKTGRLFDVQNWIAAGNSLCVPADVKTIPLEVALDTGFHSLVELLVRNESSQDLKNRALRRAVSLKRLDFIDLLASHGAEIKSVAFIFYHSVPEFTVRIDNSLARRHIDCCLAINLTADYGPGRGIRVSLNHETRKLSPNHLSESRSYSKWRSAAAKSV